MGIDPDGRTTIAVEVGRLSCRSARRRGAAAGGVNSRFADRGEEGGLATTASAAVGVEASVVVWSPARPVDGVYGCFPLWVSIRTGGRRSGRVRWVGGRKHRQSCGPASVAVGVQAPALGWSPSRPASR